MSKLFCFWMAMFNYGKEHVGPSAPKTNTGYYNLRRLAVAARCGVWLPLECVVARPFQEHRALSAIVLKRGSETGNTFFGLADMQISADTATKVINGHFTVSVCTSYPLFDTSCEDSFPCSVPNAYTQPVALRPVLSATRKRRSRTRRTFTSKRTASHTSTSRAAGRSSSARTLPVA